MAGYRSMMSPGTGSRSQLFSLDSPRPHGGRDYNSSLLVSGMRPGYSNGPYTPGDQYRDSTPLTERRSAVRSDMRSGASLRQRSALSTRPTKVSDAPPTASYDDDEDDEAVAMLMAAGVDRYAQSPDRRGMGGYGTPYKTANLEALAPRSSQRHGAGQYDIGHGSQTAAAAAGLTTHDDGLYRTNRWVTVFGFRPGLSHAVLRHFQAYGTVVSQRVSNSNWLHIQYETVDQANSALGANGRVHEGLMLGVVRCTDLTALQEDGDTGPEVGHHKLARESSSADTHLDSESIFKPRRRRKNICRRMCEYLCKSSW